MTNSTKSSSALQSQQAVSPQQREDDRKRLSLHLAQLVKDDPVQARQALEMSQEHLPEMHLISQSQPEQAWPQSVMNSDSMHSLMYRQETARQHQETMQSLLATDDLASLLEQLP